MVRYVSDLVCFLVLETESRGMGETYPGCNGLSTQNRTLGRYESRKSGRCAHRDSQRFFDDGSLN